MNGIIISIRKFIHSRRRGERESRLSSCVHVERRKKTRENEILRFNLLALAAFGFCFRYFGYFGTRREQVGERNWKFGLELRARLIKCEKLFNNSRKTGSLAELLCFFIVSCHEPNGVFSSVFGIRDGDAMRKIKKKREKKFFPLVSRYETSVSRSATSHSRLSNKPRGSKVFLAGFLVAEQKEICENHAPRSLRNW